MVQDALIDVVVSLGAPLSKLILTAPAFANSFNLVDPERNLPGSAVTGLPTTLTYQQVSSVPAAGLPVPGFESRPRGGGGLHTVQSEGRQIALYTVILYK